MVYKLQRRPNQRRVKPKTRKDVRKEKRQQKKVNRQYFHGRKKDTEQHEKSLADERQPKKRKHAKDEQDDNEIESDFTLSDEEMEEKTKKVGKQPLVKDLFKEEHRREVREMKVLEKEMRTNRVDQLTAANEDEDRVIRKLEKQLKIDKKKTNKHVPKMFNDGLDYALEMCLPENIEKMYKAAKEAETLGDESVDDFKIDMAIATGKNNTEPSAKRKKVEVTKKSADKPTKKGSTLKDMTKLRLAESKYFDEENDIDSDLAGSDSEFSSKTDDLSDFGLQDSSEQESDEENNWRSGSTDDEIDKNSSDSSSNNESDNESNHFSTENPNETGNELEDSSENDDDMVVKSKPLVAQSNIKSKTTAKLWEDIYGRTRDESGNVISGTESKYVPPQARNQIGSKVDRNQSEKLINLRRHLKGQLNRLSEANLHRIASEIEKMFMKNSRHDMNETITHLMIDALVSSTLAPERMVLEHTLLISVLHTNVGSEVGAHVLQTVIERFDSLLQRIEELDVEDKEIDNIFFVVCHLYTFKVLHSALIYEILNLLAARLCEKSIECILLGLRSIGFILRKDDPIALKELIVKLTEQTQDCSVELKENVRLKFMLDVLLGIKNNNVNKIPQYDPTVAEYLRKIMKSLQTKGKFITTFNIKLDDLLKVNERGKWWVVGSAWTGNINDNGTASKSSTQSDVLSFDSELLDLAKKQRMNTADRRNAFCTLMGSHDHIDAVDKLLRLSIKDHRVIVTVIIHCCLAESESNPYYAAVTEKFGATDRKYKIATQFALWDKIKEVQSLNSIQTKNLAQFVIQLIQSGNQALSILKIIEFGDLDKNMLRFMRQVMLGLLLTTKEDECRELFQRITASAKLNSFKESIRLFMHHFLLRGAAKSDVDKNQKDKLKQRISLADKALQSSLASVKF